MLPRIQIGSVVLRAGGERGHDHLVEREREREQPAGDERGREHRPDHEAERLPAVGAEVHRGLDQRRRGAPQPREHVVVDDRPRRRSRARSRSSRARSRRPPKVKNELSAMPVMIPGSASGSSSRNETDSRPKKRKRWIANAAAVPSTSAIAVASSADLDREPERSSRASGSFQAAWNQCSVEARDRPALDVRAVEGVDEDDQRSAARGRAITRTRPDAERDASRRFHHSASNAPSRLAITR